MGWLDNKAPGDREKPERKATLQHLWGAVRQMQQHIGGIPAQLSTIALAQSRTDARVESLANMLAEIRRAQLGAVPHGQCEPGCVNAQHIHDEDQDHEAAP